MSVPRFLVAVGLIVISPVLAIPLAALTHLVFEGSIYFDLETLRRESSYVTGIVAGWWVFGVTS